MTTRWTLLSTALTASLAGGACAAPLAGQDYYSLQIASAPDARALERAFGQHVALPFVRVEQRGKYYVLRAGFWPDLATARNSLAQFSSRAGQLRLATYRPPAIRRKNWESTNAAQAPAIVGAAEAPAPIVASGPLRPGVERPAPAPFVKPVTESLRAFDAQDYALAYDALLGAGDLQRAYEVAQKAVQSLPQDRSWRLRLAQVSQWTDRPQVMAEQWLSVFEQGDHSPSTVAKVIELAPLAGRPLVALQAWAIYAQQRSLSDPQWRDILALYESAALPVEGADFFTGQFKRSRHPPLLEYAARLAKNAGDDERAEALYAQRAELEPFSLDSVLHAVVSQVRRGKMREALALMQAHEARVPDDAMEYWRLLGQVAWEMRDYDVALKGYEHYTRLPQAASSDWSRLIFLVRRAHPVQAADLAIQAYQKFGLTDQLLLGLGIYAEQGDVAAQARVFAALGDAAEQTLSNDTGFLLRRAQFRQKQKEPQAAWVDLRRALRIAPDNPDVLLATLWFLIDSGRTADLAAFLRSHGPAAADQPAMWSGYAAANQLLERHRDAVRWYDRIVRAKSDDPLMLLNYADARERIGQHGIADRLRRHAWQQLKLRFPDAKDLRTVGQNNELLAFARLSLMDQPADPGLALVRQLVRQMRGLPAEGQDSQTLALVLGWAILKEQFPNARSWMWRHYARQSLTQAPLWGQAQVALQLDDRSSMDALLRRNSGALPIYNRYDIAYALGHRQQAIDMAFQGMVPQEDEPLYERYRQHVPLIANYLQVEAQAERGRDMDSNRVHFETRLAVHPRAVLILGGMSQRQSGKDPVLSALIPAQDQLSSAEIQWTVPRGTHSLAVFQWDALAKGSGLRLSNAYQWDSRLNLNTVLSYHTASVVSQPMRVAGYEDNLSANLSYTLGKREYARILPQISRYYTQFGDALGSSQSLEVEAGYRVRTEYPDWRIRAFAKHLVFSRAHALDDASLRRLPAELRTAALAGALDPVAYFIPDGSTRTGACIDMGENLGGQNLQTTYSRAWRPFVNACLSHDSVAGPGVNASLGFAGSVTGEDHLRVQWDSAQAVAPGKGNANTLTLRYRHYY